MNTPPRPFENVLAEYLQAVDEGRAPSREALIADHPRHGEALRRFFEDEDLLHQRLDLAGHEAVLRSVAAVRPSLPTDAIPGYQIRSEIHRGGQGVVYLAVQQSTGREVAVKVLLHGPHAGSAELARFQREVELLSRLKHPNIVTIHDCGRTGDDVYLVMDYVAGHPLDAYVRNAEKSRSHRVEIEDVLRLFAKVCDGVNAAHLRGVIHRDLKPSNILVVCDNEEGTEGSRNLGIKGAETRGSIPSVPEPKVLDFGLAKLAQSPDDASSAEAMTLTGQFIGSLPWASPEQAEGRSELLDIRTDVYSLGVILYQLLTGRFPYPVSGRTDEVIRHILQTSPGRLSTIEKSVGVEVETIVLKCLAKEPDRRYQSAGELARDIRHYLANEPIEARRASMRYVLGKQLRRHWLAVSVAVSFTLLLGAGLVTSLALWYRAEAALREREEQKRLADHRADETQKVADFQSEILSGFDMKMAGAGLLRRLMEKRRAVLQSINSDEAASKTGLRELEASLAGINFTNVALETLDEMVFTRALDAAEQQFAGQPAVQAGLLQTLATRMRALGLLDRAFVPQEEAVRIRRTHLGADHPDTLASRRELGVLLQAQGKFSEAEPCLDEVMEKRRRLLGEDHVDTLTSVHDFGYVLKAQAKLDEAYPYYLETLSKRRRMLGDDHINTLTSIGDTGTLLLEQRKLIEAEPYYREALERKRRVLGDDHRNTLTAIDNMGHFFQESGKYAEAESYKREALERRRRVLGDEHPETLISLSNMGRLLLAQGRTDEAEKYLHECLEQNRRVLGEYHPDTLSALTNMAAVFHAQGKLAQAEPYLREVFEKRRRLLGAEHPKTLFSLGNLAVLLHSQDKLGEAEPYARQVLEAHRRVLGNDHPDTLHSIAEMGSLLHDHGRLEEAQIYYAEAVDRRRRILGHDHPSTLVALHRMAALQHSLGKSAEAEALFREVLEGRLVKLPREHRDTAITRVGLARVLIAGACDPGQTITSRAAILSEAEAMLAQARDVLEADPGVPSKNRVGLFDGYIELCDARNTLEPDLGYDARGAEWRAGLIEWQATTQPATQLAP